MGDNKYNYQTKNKQAFCPICSSGYRYFYTLSNNSVILLCDECESVWLDSNKLDDDDAVSDKVLETKFNVDKCKSLFNNFNKSIAGWSTEKDIKNSCWNTLAEDNELFIFSKKYNLADKEKRYPFSYLFNRNEKKS